MSAGTSICSIVKWMRAPWQRSESLFPLLRSVIKRVAFAVPTIFGVVLVSFALTRLLPGDPAFYFAGAAPAPGPIPDIRKSMFLVGPLCGQFCASFVHMFLCVLR